MGNVGNCSGFWKFIDVTEIGYVYIYMRVCKKTQNMSKKMIFHHLCLLLVENKSTSHTLLLCEVK